MAAIVSTGPRDRPPAVLLFHGPAIVRADRTEYRTPPGARRQGNAIGATGLEARIVFSKSKGESPRQWHRRRARQVRTEAWS